MSRHSTITHAGFESEQSTPGAGGLWAAASTENGHGDWLACGLNRAW